MTKDKLEAKVRKAILAIDNKVTGIYNMLGDLSLKLCHIIKSRSDYYSLPDRSSHYK